MTNSHYIKHPDHLSIFFNKLKDPPYKFRRWQRQSLRFPKYSSETVGFLFFPIIIGLIVFLYNWAYGKLLFWWLSPIVISILIIIVSFIYGFIDYLFYQFHISKKIKSYPQDCVDWIGSLSSQYKEYQNKIAEDFEYLFNSKTTQGRTAHLLKRSLEVYGIDANIEAYLKWRGLNLLPKNPYRRKRSEGQRSWYDQFKFTADFVVVDKAKGVMIDIEIDEAHHFEDDMRSKKDDRRNQIFLLNRWSIIRFKDIAITSNANSCAESVNFLIKEIESMHSNILASITKLKFDELYNKEDYKNIVLKDLNNQKLNWLKYVELFFEYDGWDYTYYPANFRIDQEGGDPIRKYMYKEYLSKKSNPGL